MLLCTLVIHISIIPTQQELCDTSSLVSTEATTLEKSYFVEHMFFLQYVAKYAPR